MAKAKSAAFSLKKPSYRGTIRYYYYTTFIATAYLLVYYSSPINRSTRFQISVAKTRLLQVTIAIPIILIWFLATYGVTHFKRYAEKIKKSPDGKALDALAGGYLVLVYGGLIASNFFSAFSAYATHGGHRIGFTILNRYISVGLGLIAFGSLLYGSGKVVGYIKGQQKRNWLFWLAILGGIAYTYLLSHYPYRQSTPNPDYYASFYLKDSLLLFTVILPTVFSWVMGALAVANIETYAQKAKGTIYRAALAKLVRGTQCIILVAISLQMLTGLSTVFSTADLKTLLLLIYAILALYAVGWIIIARGARRLRRIEEV